MALLDIRNLNIEIQTPNVRIKIVDGVNLSLNEGEILVSMVERKIHE